MAHFHWFIHHTWLQDISLWPSGENQYSAIWLTIRLAYSSGHLMIFNKSLRFKNIFGVVALRHYFQFRVVALWIDFILFCLEQNKIAASRFARISVEEREKHSKLKSNKKIVNKDAAQIFKESLKDENDILESMCKIGRDVKAIFTWIWVDHWNIWMNVSLDIPRETKTLIRFVCDWLHKYIGLIKLIDGDAKPKISH